MVLIVFALVCYLLAHQLCSKSKKIERLDWRLLALTLLILNALDLLTTRIALRLGGAEGNEFIGQFVLTQGETFFSIHKLVIGGAAFLTMSWLAKKSLSARLIAVASLVAFIIIVVWNTLSILYFI